MNFTATPDRSRFSMLPTMPNQLHPLRVAMVASSLRLAGAEKQTAYLTRALFDAGAETQFFHLGEGGHYEAVLRGCGISFRQIYRKNRPLSILARLVRALRRFRPQIVFAPQFGDLLHAGVAGRLCDALVLGGLRSDGFYELNSHGRWSRWILRLAHGMIANSHRARQNLRSRIAAPPEIVVLPNVLDLSQFDARSKMAPPIATSPNRIMVVAVGSLQPSKRFDRFLKALALARRKAPALLGVIAGADCGSGSALAEEARGLGLLPDHIVFLGECPNVPALLAHADFLVLSSEYEGFPNVLLEAMAAGLPAITTRVGDAERIVLHEQTGYVVDEPIVESLAEHMVVLAASPVSRLRLGSEGRRRVAQEYNYEFLPIRLLSVFGEFASKHPRRRLLSGLRSWSPVMEANREPKALLWSEPAT